MDFDKEVMNVVKWAFSIHIDKEREDLVLTCEDKIISRVCLHELKAALERIDS